MRNYPVHHAETANKTACGYKSVRVLFDDKYGEVTCRNCIKVMTSTAPKRAVKAGGR